jgi:hypothetical protein
VSSVTRISGLDRVFCYGSSDLLNGLARLSVLYEDFRIEWYGLNALASFGALDTIGKQYRALYFLRRSLATLTEYHGCLAQILSTREFKSVAPSLAKMHAADITAANRYFQGNLSQIKELRNELGGHFKPGSVEFATANLPPDICGKVTWCSQRREDNQLSLELHYANEVLAGAISSRLQGGVDLVEELQKALDVVMQGYTHVHCSMLALARAFLWDRFGR